MGKVEAPEMPVIGISLQAKLDKNESRVVVLQTHVPQDTPRAEVNKIVDLLAAVGNRQSDASRLHDMEFELALHEKALAYAKEDVLRVEERNAAEWESRGRKGPWQPSAKEAVDRQNSMANVKRLEDEIAWHKERQGQLRERIKKDDYAT